MAKELISIENTKFIFATNFEGDPNKDKFKSPARKGNIILNEEQAKDLMARGFNVKVTKPKPDAVDEFVPTYYVSIIVRYGDNPNLWPKVYLVTDGSEPVKLGPDTLGMIDDIWVRSVDVICGEHEYDVGKSTLYVRVMYVTQNVEEDPFAQKYMRSNAVDLDVPF